MAIAILFVLSGLVCAISKSRRKIGLLLLAIGVIMFALVVSYPQA